MTLGYALDVGCGNGITLYGYQKRWVGIDNFFDLSRRVKEYDRLKEEWIHWPKENFQEIRARGKQELLDFYKRNSNIPFIVADGRVIPIKDTTFDTVLLSEILEHVPDPEKLLLEAIRVTKPLGRVVITVPIEHEWDKSVCPFEDEVHVLHFTVGEVRTLLESVCKKTMARIHLFYHTKRMENAGFVYVYAMILRWPDA